MRSCWFFIFAQLGLAGVAFAEGGCPPGQYPYNTPQARQCVPMPGGGGYSEPEAPVHETPLIHFSKTYTVDRWGAVAWDMGVREPRAGIGMAQGKSSQAKAEKAALAQCRASGGSKGGCKILVSYANGCVAMADGRSGVRSPNVGDTLQEAIDLSMKRCQADTQDCRVFYQACSLQQTKSCAVAPFGKCW